MSIRCLNNKTGLPLTSEEILALETYEAECDRGLVHTPVWHQVMRQLQVLHGEHESKCSGGNYGISPRDPAFTENHRFDGYGKCVQCGLRRDGE